MPQIRWRGKKSRKGRFGLFLGSGGQKKVKNAFLVKRRPLWYRAFLTFLRFSENHEYPPGTTPPFVEFQAENGHFCVFLTLFGRFERFWGKTGKMGVFEVQRQFYDDGNDDDDDDDDGNDKFFIL